MNFELTYSSNPTINKNLIQIYQEYRNKGQNPYIIFFKMQFRKMLSALNNIYCVIGE